MSSDDNEIPSLLRRTILEALWFGPANSPFGLEWDWSGRLDEVDFLSALFELDKLPSHDHRFKDVAGDIYQHRINNPNDWENHWIISDTRFNLRGCDDALFLKFLERLTSPYVRLQPVESDTIAEVVNTHLPSAGYHMVKVREEAGWPIYEAKKTNSQEGLLSEVKDAADFFNAGWMARESERLRHQVNVDPEAAIGGAKELIESCCKTILEHRGVEIAKADDFPKILKLAMKELNLSQEDIPDKTKAAKEIKTILSNLGSIAQRVNVLRNEYGKGHGRAGNHSGLTPRHAKLVVYSASTLVIFLIDTYEARFGKPT